MALEDAVVGSLVGVVGGFLLGLYAQNWNIKRNRHESTKERVYSPLFDEIEGILKGLKKNDPEWYPHQWSKITVEQHLSYLIEPPKLYESLRKFYDETFSNVINQIVGSRKAYGELVKEDLMAKVTSAAASIDTGAPKTLPAINEVSTGVGSTLFKGEVWFGDLPRYNQNYDSLKTHSSQLPATFQEYFDWWKDKSRDDKIMVDYRRFREQTLREATDLRKSLAKKLAKKL
jgi:hypothetical protein